jgi:MHS family proline/betaine transporter-like MFS transporter
MAGVAGNVLEWYDFAVYGYFAPIIAGIFFPSADPVVSLVAAFGAFAAGFLMRPFGGAVFGHIGDKIGRSRALLLSVILMAIPTFVIGLLPGYATIGAVAAVVMVLLRMLQGLSVGGEYTSSVVFLVEHAPTKRRGFFSSWTVFGAVAGVLLGSAISALMSVLLTDAELQAWGWRIPFLLGIFVGAVGWLIRHGIPELPVTKREPGDPSPVIEAFRDEWRAMLQVIGFNIMNAIAFYMLFVYMVTFLIDNVKEPRSTALDINTISMVVLMVLIPIVGALSDRIGRKPLLLISTGGMLLLTYPLMLAMHHPNDALILGGQVGFAIILAAFYGTAPVTMAEVFPARVRVSALSVGYNVCLAIFGGTTPLVAVWLVERTHDDLSMAYYLMVGALISFLVVLRLPETARRALN